MTTLTGNYNHSQTVNQTKTSNSAYQKLIKRLEFSHYGILAMSILIGSCLGGITTMQIFENNAPTWQFALCASVTMASLVSCIGQLSTKWVVNCFAGSVVINIILLLINVL